jgi:hypothetical protein
MDHERRLSLLPLLALVLGLGACQGGTETTEPATPAADTVAAAKPVIAAPDQAASPGKPTAPIQMSYEIVGNPIVGLPALINVHVSSSQGPVTVLYSINDTSALAFQQGQVERLEIVDPAAGSTQQLTVIPQREGRLYVTVSAEVQTPGGAMIRSMAIPIKVGVAPDGEKPQGEVREGPDGETVISLPAREPN